MHDTPTVLVVDDNRPLTDAFARALPEEYEVRTAYTGEEARESFGERVDAVVLDRRLPDASGEDLLDEFREERADCSVAVVSAHRRTGDLDCEAYLRKPVGGDTVRETVAGLLGDETGD